MQRSDAGPGGLHFVVPGELEQLTGGYIYDRRIVAELRALGVEVSVHGLRGAFPVADEAARGEAARIAEEIAPGATVVVDGLALPAFCAQIEALARQATLVALVHHPLFLETDSPSAHRTRLMQQEARALSHCAGVVVTSEATRSDVSALGIPEDIVAVVEPGVEPVPSAPTGRSAPVNSAGRALNLLCVGSVIERKGHVILIEALSRMRDLCWRLDCVGSLEREPGTAARLRAALERTGLNERVDLHGEVPSEELARLYSTADLFVLASRHEGYGMALTEAMSYGIPVVSTNAGAIPRTVPAAAGILVPPNDPAGLAEAMRKVVQDEGVRHAMGRAARAVGRPSWPEAGRQFLRALRAIEARDA